MSAGPQSESLSPEPILAAIDDYHGVIVDLSNSLVVQPHSLSNARWATARKMSEAGLRAGQRVVLALGNGPRFIVALVSTLMRGGSPIPVHWETPAAELKRIARRFNARFIVTDSGDTSGLEAVGATVSILDDGGWARMLWADFGGEHQPDGALLPLAGVPLHPTSGTTGEPKVAVRPAACAIAEARTYQETLGIDHHDRLLALAPMSHAFGFGWYVVTPIVTGADIVSMQRFNPKLAFQACQEWGITVMPAVGAILDSLMFGAGDRLYDPSRRVFTGGAPVSDRTARNFQKLAGASAFPLYGATEAGAIAVVRANAPMPTRGCVGRPFKHVQVEIRQPLGESQFDNGVGLVHVRSPSVMCGYLINEQIDTSPLADGWFNTGDLGWVDDHGLLHLRGRHAEVINVSGMKVLPSEVEDVIAAMPGVKEVKVYAGSTRSGLQHVRAAVAGEGLDASQIKAVCQEQLVYYKRPSRITVMESLPRSSAGKIVRSLLP